MITDWTIQDEILGLTQRWPWLFLAFLVGCFLGWGVSYALPPKYQAEAGMYVAFNADTELSNPDDYKNWQMGQLDAFVLSDEVVQTLLANLTSQDSSWENLAAEDLGKMLSVRWRNAGKWRLAAVADSSQSAFQIARTWRDVVFQQLSDAIQHANQFNQIDRELNTVAYRLSLTRERSLALEQARQALLSWLEETRQSESSGPLDARERWRLQNLVARVSNQNLSERLMLEEMPPPDAEVQEYFSWIDRALAGAEDDLHLLELQEKAWQAQRIELNLRWSEEERSARGLSAYLYVEPLNQGAVEVRSMRSPALVALVGGLFGLIAFVIVRLACLTLRG
ncbi:MAG TPA: hypothetical protein VE136_08795 [Anaerolineales bacterium]|nr:hypothetical protein [Anaerolineales bacterium]